jgi:hypothetical protein
MKKLSHVFDFFNGSREVDAADVVGAESVDVVVKVVVGHVSFARN